MTIEEFRKKYPIEAWITNPYKININDVLVYYDDKLLDEVVCRVANVYATTYRMTIAPVRDWDLLSDKFSRSQMIYEDVGLVSRIFFKLPTNIYKAKKDLGIRKECTCTSYDLFWFGCKCNK